MRGDTLVQDMPPMLAYTITGSLAPNVYPRMLIGQGPTRKAVWPSAPADDTYWIVFLDANNPTSKVQEFVVPAQNNSAVPSGIDAYMSNPAYLFAVVTQYLNGFHLPQGDFDDYLTAHGAGRELQRLEQLSMTFGCGSISRLSYLLTGRCGPPPAVAYENGSNSGPAMLLMSLMPLPNGQPPYSPCNSYTFITRH
jgi:hypothetical protein